VLEPVDVKTFLDRQRILVTGGTGSFGRAFVERVLSESPTATLIVYSRDEAKHEVMARQFDHHPNLRFFIGDVRDKDRLWRAMRGVTTVVHAAALKVVPTCEYNPFEAVQTNILGAQYVCEAALDRKVGRILALSTDKACQPINLYGATKLCLEKIVTGSNAYSGSWTPRFSCVRYGNVAGSRGSVIPLWRSQDTPTVTDWEMTRFWMTLDRAVDLVLFALTQMVGGEIFIPILPSITLRDLAVAMSLDEKDMTVTGKRPGEKDHESLVGVDEVHLARKFPTHYLLRPTYSWHDLPDEGEPCIHPYTSHTNPWFLSVPELQKELANVES
jgi:UDP-N-acetylglucosamine 4,6-dehydratase